MKPSHPTKQRLDVKKLLKRCNDLEDCVMSQQKVITERESEITNMRLAHALMKQRYEDAMKFLELNRPEILQLMKVHAKHGALAAAGKLPSVTVKLTKRKLKAPTIPVSPPPVPAPESHPTKGDLQSPSAVSISIRASGNQSSGTGVTERYDFKTRKFVEEP